ncbi:MAG: hypothetical protein QNJ36_03105 [Calothrix sp. MO_167.B42]|nr:hypothetical protein [Calothrix sp. MO_167.B42]
MSDPDEFTVPDYMEPLWKEWKMEYQEIVRYGRNIRLILKMLMNYPHGLSRETLIKAIPALKADEKSATLSLELAIAAELIFDRWDEDNSWEERRQIFHYNAHFLSLDLRLKDRGT